MGKSGTSGPKEVQDDNNEVLEKLAGKSHYCFLDGFSGYMQIQSCPLINIRLPSHAHSEHSLTHGCLFMDDFTVYAESFEACLENLSRVLRRCMEIDLILNFEKCHFMVTKGIIEKTLNRIRKSKNMHIGHNSHSVNSITETDDFEMKPNFSDNPL
ncbi:hypothetical protein CR513_16520, partial [Mucuna pruriens]